MLRRFKPKNGFVTILIIFGRRALSASCVVIIEQVTQFGQKKPYRNSFWGAVLRSVSDRGGAPLKISQKRYDTY